MKKYIRFIYKYLVLAFCPFYIGLAFIVAYFARFQRAKLDEAPRLVWGATPIINYSYWSRAMERAGFSSETYTMPYYESINCREDWDKLIGESFSGLPYFLKPYLIFLESLLKYDVFFSSCDGYFLGMTPLWRFEALLLRAAGKKSVIFPYGGDSFVYGRIQSQSLAHCLLMSYPDQARRQDKIAARLDYWIKNSDIFIPGFLCVNGFGRWDVITPSVLHVDLDIWNASSKDIFADGGDEPVTIVHAPNHRGFKGTEFIIQAVDELKAEGLNIGFLLLEKLQNSEVRQILETKADILVEQLIYTGHGLNGLEGLASGVTTISNLEDDNFTSPFRRWSFLDECPIVSASPETIKDTLRVLIKSPNLRKEVGVAGRAYAEKYHGYAAAAYMFNNIIDKVWHEKEVDLINMFHPILGEFPRSKPVIEHPLVRNKIQVS